MSDRYQRHAVISTDDVHYGPLIPGDEGLATYWGTCGASVSSSSPVEARKIPSHSPSGELASTAVDLSSNQITHARRLATSVKVWTWF